MGTCKSVTYHPKETRRTWRVTKHRGSPEFLTSRLSKITSASGGAYRDLQHQYVIILRTKDLRSVCPAAERTRVATARGAIVEPWWQ